MEESKNKIKVKFQISVIEVQINCAKTIENMRCLADERNKLESD